MPDTNRVDIVLKDVKGKWDRITLIDFDFLTTRLPFELWKHKNTFSFKKYILFYFKPFFLSVLFETNTIQPYYDLAN